MANDGELTEEIKQSIDAMDYEQMLSLWRNASVGSPHFIGKRGQYFAEAMKKKRDADPTGAVAASKRVGW